MIAKGLVTTKTPYEELCHHVLKDTYILVHLLHRLSCPQ